MRLLLIPDPTSPYGEDAFCREVVRRAPARSHEAAVEAIPNGPLQATLDRLSATGFASASDAVVINSLQPAALLAAKAAGKKAAVRLIDSYASATPEALAEVRLLAAQADLLLVPSRHLLATLKGWGMNGRSALAPYAYDRINAQQIALVTMRASRPAGFPVVAAAPLNESTRPGFETLIAALSRLRLDIHLTVSGEGPARPALEAKAKQFMVEEKIHFIGPLPHAKLMEFCRAARVFIDPCGLDGFPSLILYALSEGCPVIAARAGAVPELVTHGENGLLFSPGDPHGLSEALTTLSSERGLSLRLIEGGIKTVEGHTWDRTVEAVFAAVEGLK